MSDSTITLTAALRSNLLSLQGTQTLLDQTQLRLASGKKVNSALDNPSAYFQSQALTARAGDLSNLLDRMGQSVQVMKSADQGITSVTSLVQQAQAIAESARDSLSNTAMVRSGDMSAATVSNLTAGGFANNDAFTIQIGGVTAGATITISTGETLAQLAAAINTISGISATIVDPSSAVATGGKRLEIRATGGQTLTLTDATAGTVAKLQANNGGAGGIVGITGTGGVMASGVAVASTSNTPDEISLEEQYKNVRAQIDTLVQDAGYQGTNLLNGDTLQVQFNEQNTSLLKIVGVTFNSAGLGISFTGNGASSSFLTSTSINSSLTEVTSALATLRLQAQSFGNNLNVIQTRQDFTQNLINTLKAGSDQLVLADKNEEGANLLSLQTSQQLGIQALSLASQANQSVLRLFQ